MPPWRARADHAGGGALHGSGVGLLPRGKLIGVETMLHGLLLVSGNDAAIALAQRAAGGSQRRFVRLMNERAQAMGLTCTRYSTPSGIRDAGNHSCAGDLAALAPRRAAPAAAGAGSCATLGRAAVPDRGREALPLQHEPAAARRATAGPPA